MAGSNVLYNGIALPETWPPENINPDSQEPMPVPYLDSPPPVIPIDTGRQLFVDDFLIESASLQRTYHHAEKFEGNPILKPETELESNRTHKEPRLQPDSAACPFDDAVIYDPKDGLFKMWYMAGHEFATAIAYSRDGIHWERPKLDVIETTNCVIPYDPDFRRDSFAPWLDYHAESEQERFKAFFYDKAGRGGQYGGWLYTSPDGIHWQRRARVSAAAGDSTSLFYNPFRKKWVLCVRKSWNGEERVRYYYEHFDFLKLAETHDASPVFWAKADRLDVPDPDVQPAIPGKTQLYALAASGYESVMLGMHTIHYGPRNDVCRAGQIPKLTEPMIAFSRDGFHWDRPDRSSFIKATRREGDWDRGYLRSAGGCCLVVGDLLYFYYCGFSGVSMDGEKAMYAGGSTHLAFLRRDGFASMNAGEQGGELVTRPLLFNGRHMFANLDAKKGMAKAEVLNQDGDVIEPFSAGNCDPIVGDKTMLPVSWLGVEDLSAIRGRPVKLRFHLRSARLYSFWISPHATGASHGYVAAGGPGFNGLADS